MEGSDILTHTRKQNHAGPVGNCVDQRRLEKTIKKFDKKTDVTEQCSRERIAQSGASTSLQT